MEKIYTCTLHKGFSQLAPEVNESIVGKKVNLVLDLKKKTIKFLKKDDYEFTYILPTLNETIPLIRLGDHIAETNKQRENGSFKPGQLDMALFTLSLNHETKKASNASDDDLFFESQNVYTYFTGEPPKGKTEAFYYVSKISLGSNRFSIAVQNRDYDMKNLKIIPREPSNDIRVFDFESEEKF